MDKVYNVLFLCTGNSARSIMAECIMNREGKGRFMGFSAGSHPTGKVNPDALVLLKQFNYPTGELRSKNWDEFAAPDAPKLDFVFTVCDSAAGEVCPVWPGNPMTVHWGVPDPAAFEGSDAERHAYFADIYGRLANRISIFCSLPFERLDRLSLQTRLHQIGEAEQESVSG